MGPARKGHLRSHYRDGPVTARKIGRRTMRRCRVSRILDDAAVLSASRISDGSELPRRCVARRLGRWSLPRRIRVCIGRLHRGRVVTQKPQKRPPFRRPQDTRVSEDSGTRAREVIPSSLNAIIARPFLPLFCAIPIQPKTPLRRPGVPRATSATGQSGVANGDGRGGCRRLSWMTGGAFVSSDLNQRCWSRRS